MKYVTVENDAQKRKGYDALAFGARDLRLGAEVEVTEAEVKKLEESRERLEGKGYSITIREDKEGGKSASTNEVTERPATDPKGTVTSRSR